MTLRMAKFIASAGRSTTNLRPAGCSITSTLYVPDVRGLLPSARVAVPLSVITMMRPYFELWSADHQTTGAANTNAKRMSNAVARLAPADDHAVAAIHRPMIGTTPMNTSRIRVSAPPAKPAARAHTSALRVDPSAAFRARPSTAKRPVPATTSYCNVPT